MSRKGFLVFAMTMMMAAAISALQVGVAKHDASLPVNIPLAGFNHGDRRVPHWPLPEEREYTTFMMPGQGRYQPTWSKAVVMEDDDGTLLAWCTMDGIGSDETLNQYTIEKLQALGSRLSLDNVIFSSSHTHSGPGAISPRELWALAPATDLLVVELQQQMAENVANAIWAAEQAMKPAKMNVGIAQLIGASKNRRAGKGCLSAGTIDPNLGVVRIDYEDGSPAAVLWNFALHGVCFGPSNMKFSGDIMGAACDIISETLGVPALFINGDAGDIDPCEGCCAPNNASYPLPFKGSVIMADAVLDEFHKLEPSADVNITVHSQFVGMGKTSMNLTLDRISGCDSGGFLDICSICKVLDCDANLHLDDNWIDEATQYIGFRLDIKQSSGEVVSTVGVTMPGEMLVEGGWIVRNNTLAQGFDQTLLFGYSQSHYGYFATPDQYVLGGYESELTFWGVDTAITVTDQIKAVTAALAD